MMSKPFSHKAVADLAWVIRSPTMLEKPAPYLNSGQIRWWKIYAEGTLQALDSHPKPLLKFLKKRPTHRLGKYYEHLLEYWFSLGSPYRLIEKGLQVFREKQTIGEMDFLVTEVSTGKILHLEVAVKFYLGVGGSQWTDWIGPNPKDSLSKKCIHLEESQILLSTEPEGEKLLHARGIEKVNPGIFLKGCFYCPHPSYQEKMVLPEDCQWTAPSGHWIRLADFEKAYGKSHRWRLMDTPEWIPSDYAFPEDDFNSMKKTLSRLEKRFEKDEHPVLLTGQSKENKAAQIQLFVVQANWPDSNSAPTDSSAP